MKKIIIVCLTLMVTGAFADDAGDYAVKRMMLLNTFALVEACQKQGELAYFLVENKEVLDRAGVTKKDLGNKAYLIDEAKATKLSAFDFFKKDFEKCLANAKKEMESKVKSGK